MEFESVGKRDHHIKIYHQLESKVQVRDRQDTIRKVIVKKVQGMWNCPEQPCPYSNASLAALQKHCIKAQVHIHLEMEPLNAVDDIEGDDDERDSHHSFPSDLSDEEQEPLLPQGMYLYLILINRTHSVSKTG